MLVSGLISESDECFDLSITRYGTNTYLQDFNVTL